MRRIKAGIVLFLMLCSVCFGSVKIGIIADVHYDNSTPPVEQYLFPAGSGDAQYRQTSTADARMAAAMTTFESEGCDFVVQIGDLINGMGSNNGFATAALTTITSIDIFSGVTWHVLGNHEAAMAHAGTINITTEFWDDLDTQASAGDRTLGPWQAAYNGVTDDAAYYWEQNGIRFVVLEVTGSANSIENSAAQRTWLTDNALETTKPVIVFIHAGLIVNPIYSYANMSEANAATIRGLLEATPGQVQAVFNGHFHRNTIGGYGSDAIRTVVNDIQYFGLRGSVLGAADGVSSDTATAADGAYYIIDVLPNAYGDPPQANVTITGFLKGQSKSIDTFVVF